MIHFRIRTAQGEILRETSVDELAKHVRDLSTLVWLDLDSPTPDELALIAGILNWSHFTVEDLVSLDERAKIESFDGYSVLVMHELAYEGTPKRLKTPEVDFVVGPNYIASVNYHNIQHIIETRDINQHLEAIVARGPDYWFVGMSCPSPASFDSESLPFMLLV